MQDEFYKGNTSQIEISDQYEHIDPSIEYLLENEIFEPENPLEKNSKEYQNLSDLVNSVYTTGCNCTNLLDCSKSEKCIHGGNYIKIKKSNDLEELVLNPQRKCKDVIYECFEYCKCSNKCNNRLVQYGPRKYLKIIESYRIENHKGLITIESIPNGGFICEYAGEIITKYEAERRHKNNIEGNQMNYIICLNEYCIDSSKNAAPNMTMMMEKGISKDTESKTVREELTATKINVNTSEDQILGGNGTNFFQTFIDPSKKGNIGRYLNHSCNPNCHILSVRVNGPVPKLGIFAKRDIEPYEELCFHYSDGQTQNFNDDENLEQQETTKCLCGSENCQKFLPNLKF